MALNPETTKPQTDHQMVMDFFELCQKEDYIKLITLSNMKIPGFSSNKRITNLPLSVLKSHVTKAVFSQIHPENILKGFSATFSEAYEGLSEQEFIYKIKLDTDLSKSHAYALFCSHFPEFYLENQERIHQNIRNKKPFYDNLMTESFSDQIQTIPNAYMEEHLKHLEKVLSEHPMNEKWTSFFKEEGSLKERLEAFFPKAFEGFYLKMYRDDDSDYKKWNAKERESLLRLALQDAVSFSFYLMKASAAQDEEHQKHQETITQLEAQLEKKSQQNKELKKKFKEFEKESQEAWRELETQEKDKQGLVNDFLEARIELEASQGKIEQLEEDLQEVRNRLEEAESFQEKQSSKMDDGAFTLFNETITLISKVEAELFSYLFANSQFVKARDDNDFERIISQISQSGETIFFINTDGLSSKLLFKLEKVIKKKGVTYRMVGGGPRKVMRLISFYLEGGMENETN